MTDEAMDTPAIKQHGLPKGNWSGCSWGENPCACNDDGNVTGWLPVAAKKKVKTP